VFCEYYVIVCRGRLMGLFKVCVECRGNSVWVTQVVECCFFFLELS